MVDTVRAPRPRTAASTGAKTPRRGLMKRREAMWCYIFMAPAILGIVLFSLGPMIASFFLSFNSYDLMSPPEWVGAENFTKLAADPIFLKSLRVTVTYSAVSVPAILVIAFLLALLLNAKIPAMGFFRSAFYLPSVISGVAVAMVWRWMFDGDYGLINEALGFVGIDGPPWLTDERFALSAVILTSLWGFGGTLLIYLAGLQGVPPELYEAAQVDGASRFRQHLHVTIPMLSNVTFFNLVMGIIGSLQVFAEPFVLTGGKPNNSTLLLPLYLYQNAFTYLKMGYASAIAWVTFAMILLLTLIVFKSLPFWVHTEAEER